MEPLAETTHLYEQLKGASSPPPHNLPPQPTLFVGRDEELQHITSQLNDPACRLLTITGSGGIGKTRLATKIAARYLDPTTGFGGQAATVFPDGVYYVPLARLIPQPQASNTRIDSILLPIAQALNLPQPSTTDLFSQLLTHLQREQSKVLFVLDNFEHLLAADSAYGEESVRIISHLLQNTRHLKLLVTSQERLNLQEEWVVELQGLTYPTLGHSRR